MGRQIGNITAILHFMRRHVGKIIAILFCVGFAGLIWYALDPGPPIPGDQRWCQAIRDKPVTEWTLDEARGFAELNCMRWRLRDPSDNQNTE